MKAKNRKGIIKMEENRNLKHDRAIKDGYRHYLSEYSDIAANIKTARRHCGSVPLRTYRANLRVSSGGTL